MLNDAQLAERRLGIGGTDAGRIMAGELLPLWREKLGLAEPEDLSNVLPVQLGSFTEPFNRHWYERQTGRAVTHAGERRVHATIPYMVANLDGLSTTARGELCYWDAKHVGKLDEATVLRYTPQMTHCALICGLDWWCLSVLIGNSKWQLVEQEVDPFYAAELLTREREFWGYVERREEPPALAAEPVLPPKPAPTLRIVQLEDQFRAEWPNWGAEMVERFGTFAGTWNAYTAHNISREEIKRLLPEDVGTVTRGRIKVARDKAGAIRMNLLKDPGEKANG